MLFTEEFLSSSEKNPVAAVLDACDMADESISSMSAVLWKEDEHDILWEISTVINLIIETNDLHTNAVFPSVTSNINKNCKQLVGYINVVKVEFKAHETQLKIDTYKNRYQIALKSTFAYEFSQGDLDRVQVLVNELRGQITEANNLEPEHKERLLKRLETLQSELHKRVSDLDKFWGMVGDAGVVLGKLGKDAKPIVDRVKEIAEIVWQTQARAEELPSNAPSPLLEHDEDT